MAEKKGRTTKAAEPHASTESGGSVIWIDVHMPRQVCTDVKCPFHGRLPVRGQMLEGIVVSTKMQNTVVVERQYLRYIQKFERYEKRTHRLNVHAPPCLGLQVGHRIVAMECRPLGKAVNL